MSASVDISVGVKWVSKYLEENILSDLSNLENITWKINTYHYNFVALKTINCFKLVMHMYNQPCLRREVFQNKWVIQENWPGLSFAPLSSENTQP